MLAEVKHQCAVSFVKRMSLFSNFIGLEKKIVLLKCICQHAFGKSKSTNSIVLHFGFESRLSLASTVLLRGLSYLTGGKSVPGSSE